MSAISSPLLAPLDSERAELLRAHVDQQYRMGAAGQHRIARAVTCWSPCVFRSTSSLAIAPARLAERAIWKSNFGATEARRLPIPKGLGPMLLRFRAITDFRSTMQVM